MDLYLAISLYRRKKYDECIQKCNTLLKNNSFHKGPWELKMRSMTNRVYVDDIEADDGIVGIKKYEEKKKRKIVVSKKKWDWNLGFCVLKKECCCSCGFVILLCFAIM